MTADEFLLELLDRSPGAVMAVLTAQAARYKREPKTVDGLAISLERGGVPQFADEVRRHLA